MSRSGSCHGDQVINVLISGLDGGRISQRFCVKLELLKWPIVDVDWVIIVPDFITMSSIDMVMNRDWPRPS